MERQERGAWGPGAGLSTARVCRGGELCIFAGTSESGRRFAYMNIELHSPSRADRPRSRRFTKIRQVVQGGGSPPRVNVQHTRAKVGYCTRPDRAVPGHCCPLRLRTEPQLRGAARWSGRASAPGLHPAAAGSHSSASEPRLGHLTPGTRHLGEQVAGSGPPPCHSPSLSTLSQLLPHR